MSPPAVNAGRRYSDAPSPDESLPFENRTSTPSNFSFYSKRALATSDILRSVRTRPTEQAALSRVADASRPISLRLAPASGLRKLHYGVWQGSTGGNGPSAPAAPAFVADSTKGGFGLKATFSGCLAGRTTYQMMAPHIAGIPAGVLLLFEVGPSAAS